MTISAATDATGIVNLAWDANPESDIAGYRVHYGTSRGSFSSIQAVGTTPAATLSGIAPGTLYYCAVQAFNTSGLESPLSSEISFFLPEPVAPEISVEPVTGSVLVDGQSEVNLSNVDLGSSGAAETFFIKNLGTADLTGLAITADGGEFTVAPLGASTLAPGEITSFNVTFRPSAVGNRTSVIHISSNDADENPFDIGLVARGIAVPEITILHPMGADLSDSAATVHFSNSLLGTTGNAETITITNTGTADLTGLALSASGPDSGDFVLGPAAVSILAPGASTTISIAFRPTVSGLRSATLHIASNDADESPFDIALVGNGVATPDIAITQAGGAGLIGGLAAVNLGSVNLGATGAAQTFTVANLGNAELSDLGVSLNGIHDSDFLVESMATNSLSQGTTTAFKVTFKPTAAGTRHATLHITSNDPDESPFDINLTGNGVAVPEIAVAGPDTLDLADAAGSQDFGSLTIATTGTPRTYTIRNAGTGSLTGLALSATGAHASNFIISPLGVTTLAPGASTTFQVAFKPTAAGSRIATLLLASNDADENPFDLNLSGNGIAVPEIAVAGPDTTDLADGSATHNFGSLYLATTGAPRTFTIRNTGTANLTGLALSATGAHASDFIISPLGATYLAPGTTTTFSIAFTPSAAGARTVSLLLASNDADENPFNIDLSGNGVAIPVLALENADGTPVEPTGATIQFGGVILGATGNPATYTVRNTGTATLTGLQVTVTGADGSSFVLTGPATTALTPGTSTSFTVNFAPTTGGLKFAAIQVASDSTSGSPWQIALNGNGLTTPEIAVLQDNAADLTSGNTTVSLGNGDLGTTTTARTFTIRNSGTAPLTGISVASGSSEFKTGSLGATALAPGASTTFKVSFAPSASGPRAATLAIASNDTDESPFLVALTGTGIAGPEISVGQGGKSLVDENAFINFGTVNVGTTGQAQTFTIRNAGTATLAGLALVKNGINSADFTVTALKAKSLAPGASTTFKVAFKPTKVGTRWGAIHITSNDADESPFDIILTGTGKKSGTTTAASKATSGLASNSVTPAPPVKGTVVIDGRKYRTLTITKVAGKTILPRDIEVSSDLVAWASGKQHTTVLLNNAKTLKVRDNTPLTQDAKRYIRLKRATL